MRREPPDVWQREVAVTPENHRAKVPAAAKDAREVRAAQAMFGQQVFERIQSCDLWPFHMLAS